MQVKKCKLMSNLKPIDLSHDLVYLDHFCHHLVCFRKTNSFSYLYVKNTYFGKSKYLSRLVFIKHQEIIVMSLSKEELDKVAQRKLLQLPSPLPHSSSGETK